MKRFAFLFPLVFLAAAALWRWNSAAAAPAPSPSAEEIQKMVDTAMARKTPQVELVTSMGVIKLELDAVKAPITVRNFLTYVAKGHYNGTVFHRVIPGFMIQGGGMDSRFAEKRTRPSIPNEAKNGLKNRTGTIAMARTWSLTPPVPSSSSMSPTMAFLTIRVRMAGDIASLAR